MYSRSVIYPFRKNLFLIILSGKICVLNSNNFLAAFNFREKSAVPERFYPILEDHERMLEVLKASDLEWVAVLPPHITGET